MNGIININKPKGVSSFDVIRDLRKILNTRKIGHTGTLDPLATGVLVMMVGKATRLASMVEATKKTYIAEMELGYATNSYDITGETILENKEYNITREHVEETIKKFTGEIYQTPPMFSAIKKDGQRLYELARKGIEVERKKRKIHVYSAKLLEFSDDKLIIEYVVSKGTYIRTLVDDLGKDLGCYATMSNLKRTEVGDFSIDDSFNLADLKELEQDKFLFSVEEKFAFPKIMIDNIRDINLLKNGNTIIHTHEGGYVRIYTKDEFFGLGLIENNRLKPYKYFNL